MLEQDKTPCENNNSNSNEEFLVINIHKQTLSLYINDKKGSEFDNVKGLESATLVRTFSVSTAKNGIGSQEDTGCTPTGIHTIASKIGADLPLNSVLVGRKATGEIYNANLANEYPNRDWILTRILWLQGCEEGKNKGFNDEGCCDTYQRYIYIHGTPDTEPMGIPLSHGCIRMRNTDLIWLFDKVHEGTTTYIIAE